MRNSIVLAGGFALTAALAIGSELWRRDHVWRTYRAQVKGLGLKEVPFVSFLALSVTSIRKSLRAIQEQLSSSDGIFAFFSPMGKPFVVISNQSVLKDILVHHNRSYAKMHANGILELFRKTTLPHSGQPEWKPVHKIASRISRKSQNAESALLRLIAELDEEMSQKSVSVGESGIDAGQMLIDWYWQVTMLLCIGEAPKDVVSVYEQAWTSCIDRLSSPAINMFFWYQWLPMPSMMRYRYWTHMLRQKLRPYLSSETQYDWTIAKLMQDPDLGLQSTEDRVEVALEFLFTGTTSVTSTVAWLLWHLAEHQDVQERVRAECVEVATGEDSMPVLQDLPKMRYTEACLREILRMYSPIHVGRVALADDAAAGYAIPKNADLMTNMWWIHRDAQKWRDPDRFLPERFLSGDKDDNRSIQNHYFPFSMGMRGCPGQAVAFMVTKLLVSRLLVAKRFYCGDQAKPDFMANLMIPNTPVGLRLKVEEVELPDTASTVSGHGSTDSPILTPKE